jgi:hypothetical protein
LPPLSPSPLPFLSLLPSLPLSLVSEGQKSGLLLFAQKVLEGEQEEEREEEE